MPYDSKADTTEHVRLVAEYMGRITGALFQAAMDYDLSKLEPPEKPIFDEVTPALKHLTYGSEEYQAQLSKMGAALLHHYECNKHHPEHFPNGISGMTLVDLVEMFADWCAASMRHTDGDIFDSIKFNDSRFSLGILADIFTNTARVYHLGNRKAPL